MMGDLDVDFEELESRLYSQVYHSNENYENENTTPNVFEKLNSLHQNIRYFHRQTEPKQTIQNELSYIPFESNVENAITKSKTHAADFFNVNNNVNATPTIQMTNQISPSIVHVVNPNNNIVAIPQIPVEIISNGEIVQTAHMSSNLERYLNRQSRRQQKKQKWVERRKQKRKEKLEQQALKQESFTGNNVGNGDFTVHYLNDSNISLSKLNEGKDIVTISDSDSSDCCVEIPQQKVLVYISDDSDVEDNKRSSAQNADIKSCTAELDQKESSTNLNKNMEATENPAFDDDVLIIDEVPKELEIIDLDCDARSITTVDNNKNVDSVKSFETNSTNPVLKRSTSSLLMQKGITSAKERNELLRTPDSTSTSNDFLDTSVDLHQKRFNFGLHGTDFDNTATFVKPKSNTDIYETESSCSASDIGTPATKSHMFHEVEFETPRKDFFDEENLESFGNYITPNRDSTIENTSHKDDFKQVLTKATAKCAKKTDADYSDTSSESDYEIDKKSPSNKAKRKLPMLTSVKSHSSSGKQQETETKIDNVENPANQRKRNCTSETSMIPKKKSKDNDSLTESLASNAAALIQEMCKIKRDLIPKGQSDGSNGTDNDVLDVLYVPSDSDMLDESIIESNIQLINCKTKEKPPQKTEKFCQTSTFSKYWTNDMHKFYNSSWGLENFNVEDIQKTMTDDEKSWKILEEDRRFYRFNTPRGPRCRICREFGHVSFNCRNGRRRIVCTLCGEEDHLEPRCPNGICTLCGSRGGYGTYCSNCAKWTYIRCRICNMYGHIDIKCPDLWRRYHLTTEPGPIIKPRKISQKNHESRWCSGCAKSGHYEHKCQRYSRSHHSVDPNVQEYVDLYNFPKDQPFLIRCDFSPASSTPATQLEANTSKHPNENLDIIQESKASASKTSTDYTKGSIKISDITEVLNKTELPTNEDAKATDVVESSTLTSIHKPCSVQVTFDNFTFPPVEMIPPYFREQTRNSITNVIHDQSGINHTFVRNPIAVGNKIPRNEIISPNASGNTNRIKVNLNAREYGFVASLQGENLLKQLRHKFHISIDVQKDCDDVYTTGKIIITGGNGRGFRDAQRQLLRFISSSSIPKTNILPKSSKAASSFLLSKFDQVEKIVGNCKSLYVTLLKLQTQLRTSSDKTSLENKIKSTKIHLNMLLFGKLGLGDGKRHMSVLQNWQKVFDTVDDYKLPFSTQFDLIESYSYIFSDTTKHSYKRYCTVDQKNIQRSRKMAGDKELKLITRYFKLVESKCRKYHMVDKLKELYRFNDILVHQRITIKAYKEFMTFCNKFLHSVKIQS